MANTYKNFDLRFAKRPDGRYQASVLASPAGETPFEVVDVFCPPEELAEIHALVRSIPRDAGPAAAAPAAAAADPRAQVKRFGDLLYQSVFTGLIRDRFIGSLQQTEQNGDGLRVRLQLDDAPELARLPWELLYDRARQSYLNLTDRTSVVRYLQLAASSAFQVKGPINILVMVASPLDCTQLDAAAEFEAMKTQLKKLVDEKLVTLTLVPGATHDAFSAQISKAPYHVFHFIGHGDFKDTTKEAAILFEKADRTRDPISSEDLKVALDRFALRLVVLNSCEGAAAAADDPFSGMAQALAQSGYITAVIAMQFKITDKAAIKFAANFYGRFASSEPVDASLNEARLAIYGTKNYTEWVTPVLFMRADDGRLFTIDIPSEEQLRRQRIETLTGEAKDAIDNKQWDLAIAKLQEIRGL